MILLDETSGQRIAKPVEEAVRLCGLKLIRTIGSDDVLAKIGAELARRKIDLTAPLRFLIALISEWDTLYGRSLPRTFVAVANDWRKKQLAKSRTNRRWRSISMHFARSSIRTGCIAIRISPASMANCHPRKTGRMRGAKGKPGEKGMGLSRSKRRPVGRSQLDYLRRLVEQLKQEERTADGEFKAIGVLGSDVYDKLMILQALRKISPRALFTTDLDSRLTHFQSIALDAQSGRGVPFRA